MAELVLDIHLEVDPDQLVAERDPTRAIAELARAAAEEECAKQSARLRHPEPQDVYSRRAIHPATGDEVLLVAARWVADGPERKE